MTDEIRARNFTRGQCDASANHGRLEARSRCQGQRTLSCYRIFRPYALEAFDTCGSITLLEIHDGRGILSNVPVLTARASERDCKLL